MREVAAEIRGTYREEREMRIALAYSGGLDTSVALRWLSDRYDAEVFAYCANVGQLEDLSGIEEKAWATGASGVLVEDLQRPFVTEYCWPALLANAAYDRQYLLAAPMSRPLITAGLVRYAESVGADTIAHGATGKGNDQVRFAGAAAALAPRMRVIAPLLEWDMRTRSDEIAYARMHGIAVPVDVDRPYSVDTNLWGSSTECGQLDDIEQAPPPEIYLMTSDPENTGSDAETISVGFVAGLPVSVNGEALDPVDIVKTLNELGGRHGIGRIDILENRVVGFKTRGVYESPAGTILQFAHRELESITLDRDTLHFSERLSQRYSELVYDGMWFSPLRAGLDAFFREVQRAVTGHISLRAGHGRIRTLSRQSDQALYDQKFASYGDDDLFDHQAGSGFAYAFSMPLRLRALAQAKYVTRV
jgi:argininosuccinate synthase